MRLTTIILSLILSVISITPCRAAECGKLILRNVSDFPSHLAPDETNLLRSYSQGMDITTVGGALNIMRMGNDMLKDMDRRLNVCFNEKKNLTQCQAELDTFHDSTYFLSVAIKNFQVQRGKAYKQAK